MEQERKSNFRPCILALLLVWGLCTGLEGEQDEHKADEGAPTETVPEQSAQKIDNPTHATFRQNFSTFIVDKLGIGDASLLIERLKSPGTRESFEEYLKGFKQIPEKSPEANGVGRDTILNAVFGDTGALKEQKVSGEFINKVASEVKAKEERLNRVANTPNGPQDDETKKGKDGKKDGKEQSELDKIKEQLKAAQEALVKQKEASDKSAKDKDQELQALNNAARGALADAGRQLDQAKKGDGSKGGKGGGGSGGSGSGSGGDSGKSPDFENRNEPKTLADALKHLDQKRNNEPSLSQVQNQLGGDNNKGGKGDDKDKKDDGGFKLPDFSKKSAEKDDFKPKKELDGKNTDSMLSELMNPANGGPMSNFQPKVKSEILTGPTSVPNAIPDQYATSSGGFDPGGGDGGGGAGGAGGGISGGGAGGGGAGANGGGFNFNSVGQGEPYTPEPGIKKVQLEVSSINASSEGDSEGEGGSSGGNSDSADYTGKGSVKRGSEALFINQILLSGNNRRSKGLGIMAYVGATREFCEGPQGRQMALCEFRKGKGELSQR